jgi:hypothetical protein
VDDNSGAGAAAAVEEVAAGADDEVDEEGRTVPAELSHWIKESSSLSNHATGRAWFSVHSDERQSELKLKTVPAGCVASSTAVPRLWRMLQTALFMHGAKMCHKRQSSTAG